VGQIGTPVCHVVAPARRDGIAVGGCQGEALPQDVFDGMKRVAQSWLRAHGRSVELGFSMGRFPADGSERLLTAVARTPSGEGTASAAKRDRVPAWASHAFACDNAPCSGWSGPHPPRWARLGMDTKSAR
jgi:hypothetical protein